MANQQDTKHPNLEGIDGSVFKQQEPNLKGIDTSVFGGAIKKKDEPTSAPSPSSEQPSTSDAEKTAPSLIASNPFSGTNYTPLVSEDDHQKSKIDFSKIALDQTGINGEQTDIVHGTMNQGAQLIAEQKLQQYNQAKANYDQQVKASSQALGLPEEAIRGLDLVKEALPPVVKKESNLETGLAGLYKGVASVYRGLDGIGRLVGEALGTKPRSDEYFSALGYYAQQAEKAASDIESKYTPSNQVVGDIVQGASSLVPDLAVTMMMPEAKFSTVGKYSLDVAVPKFATWLGIKGAGNVKSLNPDASITDVVAGGEKGFSEGFIMDGIGLAGKDIEKVVAKLGGDPIVQLGASAVGEGLMFWGDALANDPKVYRDENGNLTFNWDEAKKHLASSFGMALAFKAQGIPATLSRSRVLDMVTKKAYLDYYTSDMKDIQYAIGINKTPKELRTESENLWHKAQGAQSDMEQSQLLGAKAIVDKVSRLKLMSSMIKQDPESFIKSVERDESLTKEQKAKLKDKITETKAYAEEKQPNYKIGDKEYVNKDEFLKAVKEMPEGSNPSDIVVKNDDTAINEASDIIKSKQKPLKTEQNAKPEVQAKGNEAGAQNVPTEIQVEQAKPTEGKAVPTESQKDVAAEFPEPSKPLSRSSGEEIRAYSKIVKDHEKNLINNVFGTEADKYKRLESRSNNPVISREEALKADREMGAMIDALSPSKKKLWESPPKYDYSELRDMASKVELVESSENVYELSSALKNPLMRFKNNKEDETTLAMFNAAKKRAIELGISTDQLIQETSKRIASEFKDPTDAEDMVKDALLSLAETSSSVQAEQNKPLGAVQKPIEPLSPEKGATMPAKEESGLKQPKTEPTEQQQKLIREAKKKENKQRLGDIFDDIAKLTGARQDLTGEERRQIRQRIVDNAIEYVKTEFDLAGEALRDKVKSFLKDNNVPEEDIVDKEIDNTIKTKGYASKIEEVRQGSQGAEQKKQEEVQPVGGVRGEYGTEAGTQKEVKAQEVTEPKRRMWERIMASKRIPDSMKEKLKESGGYKKRSFKTVQEEADSITKSVMDAGGREELKNIIVDSYGERQKASEIFGGESTMDVRTFLAASFIEESSRRANEATTPELKAKYENDATDIFKLEMEDSTRTGRELNAKKRWINTLGEHPYLWKSYYEKKVEDRRGEQMASNAKDLKDVHTFIQDILKDENFVKELEKQGYKPRELSRKERGKKTVADATERLVSLVGAKLNLVEEKPQDNVKEILVDMAKGFLDMGVGSIDELMRNIKTQVRKSLTSSQVDQYKDAILKESDAEKNLITTKPIRTDSEAMKRAVDQIYKKAQNLTREKAKELLVNSIDLLHKEGSLSDDAFKELFAKALGLEHMTREAYETIDNVAKISSVTQEMHRMVQDKIDEYLAIPESDKAKIEAVREEVRQAVDIYGKQIKLLTKSVQRLEKLTTAPMTFGEKIGNIIQGGLMSLRTAVVNVAANVVQIPARLSDSLVSSVMDWGLSGLGKLAEKTTLIDKINNNPKLRASLGKLLETERSFTTGLDVFKEGLKGFGQGGVESLKEMITGQLPEDKYAREIKKSIDPFQRWYHIIRRAQGKERASFKKWADDLVFGSIGVPSEVMFRILNLGDKPFKRSNERKELARIAKLKGLKGRAKEAFMLHPDDESLQKARMAGLNATFQNDTMLSGMISDLTDKTTNFMIHRKEKTGGRINMMDRVIQSTLQILAKTQIPYVKTPMNIMWLTMEYSTPWLALSRAVYAAANGNRRQFDSSVGVFVTGTIMQSVASALFGYGIATLAPGGGDNQDNQKVKEGEYQGKGAYRINVSQLERFVNWRFRSYMEELSGQESQNFDVSWHPDDKTWSYTRFGVVSTILMAHGLAYKGKTLEEIRDMPYWKRQTTLIGPSVNSSLELSFLMGMTNMLNALQGGNDYEKEKWFINTASALRTALIPNMYSQFVKYSDNRIRDIRERVGKNKSWESAWNDFKVATFKDTDVPIRVNVWGDEIKRLSQYDKPTKMQVLGAMFSIWDTKEYANDFGVKLMELYDRTKNDSFLRSTASNTLSINGKRVPLTTKLQDELGKELGFVRKQNISAYVNSVDYEQASDVERVQVLNNIWHGIDPFLQEVKAQFIDKHMDELKKLYEDKYGKIENQPK